MGIGVGVEVETETGVTVGGMVMVAGGSVVGVGDGVGRAVAAIRDWRSASDSLFITQAADTATAMARATAAISAARRMLTEAKLKGLGGIRARSRPVGQDRPEVADGADTLSGQEHGGHYDGRQEEDRVGDDGESETGLVSDAE